MDDLFALNNISNTYTQNSVSASALESDIKSKDFSKATDEELMAACKSFESYFVEQVFKGMEKLIPEREDKDATSSAYLDMFGDKLNEKYAEMVTNSNNGKGLGLAQMLYEQMKRNYNID